MKRTLMLLLALGMAAAAWAAAPSAWVTPKTDWATGDKPTATQLSNIGTDLGAIGNFITGSNGACASADTTVNNSTTLTTATGVTFAVSASETWAYVFVVHYISGTTPDLDLSLTFPASPTSVRYGAIGDNVSTSAQSAAVGSTRLPFNGRGVDSTAIITGNIVNGANAGNVTLKFSQTTATVSDTKVYSGSCVFAFRTP